MPFDMTPRPTPQAQTVRACLLWLDAGGDGPVKFNMWKAECGTHACMGAYMAQYASRAFGLTLKLLPPESEAGRNRSVGDWLHMSSEGQNALFYDWPNGEERDTASAAARLRAAFPQFATVAA